VLIHNSYPQNLPDKPNKTGQRRTKFPIVPEVIRTEETDIEQVSDGTKKKHVPTLLIQGRANMVGLSYAAVLLGTNSTQGRKTLAASTAHIVDGKECWTVESVVQCAIARAYVKGQEERPQNNGTVDPDLMEPKERDAWYSSEKKRIDIEIVQGNLVEVDQMRKLWGTAQRVVTQGLLTLPDRLEVEAGLSPHQVAAVEQIIDDMRLGMSLAAQEALGYVPESE
jgi:Protein of unknown function (DUF1441)